MVTLAMSRWKKTLLILCGVVLLLCLAGGGLMINFFKNQLIPEMESDAATFAENKISEISVTWSYDSLMMDAEPEMKLANDPQSITNMLNKMNMALGKLKSINGGAQLLSDTKVADKKAFGAVYQGEGTFEKGKATVKIVLVRRVEGGDWMIRQFDVTPAK